MPSHMLLLANSLGHNIALDTTVPGTVGAHTVYKVMIYKVFLSSRLFHGPLVKMVKNSTVFSLMKIDTTKVFEVWFSF